MSVAGKGGRPVGLPKTGGRKKGSPNKASLAVTEKLAAMGCDPIAILAKICMDETAPLDARIRCAIELSSYVHPKRRAIEEFRPAQPPVEVKTIVEHAPVDQTNMDDDNGQDRTEI